MVRTDKINKLEEIAEEENIPVMETECEKCGSISLLMGENCYIGIDSNSDEREYKERLAHELGHCVQGAFYNRYSHYDVVSRHEAAADRWAIEELVPPDELEEALAENLDNIYLLAERFDVSEDFMIKACKYYECYFEAI